MCASGKMFYIFDVHLWERILSKRLLIRSFNGARKNKPCSRWRFHVSRHYTSKCSLFHRRRLCMQTIIIVIVAEHREELQGALEEWNEMFKKHGLKMNLDKTEVMWVGKHREELNIRLEGKDIKQVKNCVYLGGSIYIWERASGSGGATQNTSRSECMEKWLGDVSSVRTAST